MCKSYWSAASVLLIKCGVLLVTAKFIGVVSENWPSSLLDSYSVELGILYDL
jgi:hypothetical protein